MIAPEPLTPHALARRSLVKKGMVGGALLFVGGALPIALRATRLGPEPRGPLKLLSRSEHAVFSAIAARVVPGPAADPTWPSAEALDCAGKVDALLARAHPSIGREFKQLLTLFENGLVGLLIQLAPTPFTRLSPTDQDTRLEHWRDSRIVIFRTGYQAVVRLAHATYFSSPEVYPLMGYPGPPEVPAFPLR